MWQNGERDKPSKDSSPTPSAIRTSNHHLAAECIIIDVNDAYDSFGTCGS
jgi:hypothetical protein